MHDKVVLSNECDSIAEATLCGSRSLQQHACRKADLQAAVDAAPVQQRVGLQDVVDEVRLPQRRILLRLLQDKRRGASGGRGKKVGFRDRHGWRALLACVVQAPQQARRRQHLLLEDLLA